VRHNLDDVLTGKQDHERNRPRLVNAQDGSQRGMSNVAIGAARAKALDGGRECSLQLWPRFVQPDEMYSVRDQHRPTEHDYRYNTLTKITVVDQRCQGRRSALDHCMNESRKRRDG
jgi:hypothetical protein